MTGPGSSEKVAFGCVAEPTPHFYAQVLRLVRSIRWFGGSLADADIFVCVVAEIDAAKCMDFAALGVQVRVVSAFNPLNRFCNKIRFLELPELERYKTIVLLDCDTALVQDPAPYFAQPSLQLKIADLPTVSSAVLARLCAHFGLSAPAPIYRTTCSQEPTIWYCNTGVMILPAAWIAHILPVWRDLILRLCNEPGLLDPPYNHCNQAAMTLVYITNPLPFSELPAAMNFPLNQTHRLPAPALLREDPVILHYHDRVDSDGLLLPVPYPLAQARIQQLNERLRAVGPPRPTAASIHPSIHERPAQSDERERGVDEIPPAPFIIGSGCSGATLLRLMLDSHPELAILPETHFIPDITRACQRASHPAERFVEYLTQHAHWPDFQIDAGALREMVLSLDPFTAGDGLRSFYRAYAARFGKPRYGDKTPVYCLCAEQIQALLPEARFIHLIRDGRDTVLSYRTAWARSHTVDELARHWAARVRAARRQAHELHHYLEVRYESLVLEPETTLRQICAFLDLSWDPAILTYHERAAERMDRRPLGGAPGAQMPGEERLQRVAAWRQEMSLDDLAVVEAETGDLLDELGYQLTGGRTARAPSSGVVCITGMHRSGTSLVGQILHNCGPYLGPYRLLATATADNMDGYWEHPDFRQLNDDILSHFGGGWDVAPTLPTGWEKLPELEPLRQRARTLIQQFDDQRFWGWKDPRSALTMHFWRHLIPDLKVVICVRNPLDVARSLSRRGMSSLAFGLRLWHTYYERLLAAVAPEDRIVTHYDAYFVDAAAETKRILAWLGIPTSPDIIQRVCSGAQDELRHHRTTMADLLAIGAPAAVLRLYGQLCDEASATSGAALASITPKSVATDDSTSAALSASFAAALALLRAHESELAALRPALTTSQAELAILRPVLQAREAEVAFLTPALAAREAEIADYARELETTRAILQAREAEIADYARELETTRAILQAREAEVAFLTPALAAREAEIADYARELETTRAILQAREAEIADYARELETTRAVLQAREAEIADYVGSSI
jgi:hypothetical protein